MDNSKLNKTINDLGLSVSTFNCLNRAKIKTVSDILNLGERGLLRVRNFGKTNLLELKQVLSNLEIEL